MRQGRGTAPGERHDAYSKAALTRTFGSQRSRFRTNRLLIKNKKLKSLYVSSLQESFFEERIARNAWREEKVAAGGRHCA